MIAKLTIVVRIFAITVILLLIYSMLSSAAQFDEFKLGKPAASLPFSSIPKLIVARKISVAEIRGFEFTGKLTDGEVFRSEIPKSDPDATADLIAALVMSNTPLEVINDEGADYYTVGRSHQSLIVLIVCFCLGVLLEVGIKMRTRSTLSVA